MSRLLYILIALSLVGASWGQDFAPTPEPTLAPSPVLFLSIGGSNKDVDVRTIGYNLPQTGWYNSGIDKNIDAWAVEFKKRGLPFRVLLHNPWGHDNKYPMDFDQRIEAAECDSLDVLVKSFPAWLETRLRPLLGKDGECIIYLGALDVDSDFTRLKSNPKAYRERVAASLVDVPDWASIGFDHSAQVQPGSIEWATMLHEQAGGRRIYCEARPHKTSPTVGLPVICDATHWMRTDPTLQRDSRHMASRAEMADAEILGLCDKGDEAKRRLRVQQMVTLGVTPTVGYGDLNWALDVKPETK